jgi:hypothetical protein
MLLDWGLPTEFRMNAHAASLSALVLVAGTAPALAFVDTHLDEITAPVAESVGARIAVLEAIPAPSKSEKKELKSLRALDRRLAKPAVRLSQDFAELNAAGALGPAFHPALDQAVGRAGIALRERDDFVLDHRALVGNAADLKRIDAARAKSTAALAAADATTDRRLRARLLVRAEAAATTALKLAEKLARKTGQPLPPIRLRSGDPVGAGGARVAIPRGTGSPIDGASVLLPPGSIGITQTVLVEGAASFVGGRDQPAGPAVAIRLVPGNVTVNGSPKVFVPWSLEGLPAGTNAADVTLFRQDGDTATPLPGRTLNTDGTVSAPTTALGTFQAGVQAPPLGAPDGRYVLHMIAVVTVPGTSQSAPVAFDPAFSTGVVVHEITFRRDGTGSSTAGSVGIANRSFQRTAPHHADSVANTVYGSYEFAWTAGEPGRFAFTLPLQQGQTAAAAGVASSDGNVLVLTGRGASFDFFGVALRSGAGRTAADLAGRWTGVQLGVQLLDGAAEPFRTRWTGAARDFDASDSGVLTFASSGARFATETEYRSSFADPIHVLSTSTAGDTGTETVTVHPDGRLSDASNRVRGLFAKEEDALVLGVVDTTTRQVSLLVAARQPLTLPAGTFAGDWDLARFEAGFTAGVTDARVSTQEFLGRTGALSVTTGGDASEDLFAASRATYTVGSAPPITSMTWTIAQTTPSVAAANTGFPLVLDAGGGNHRPVGGPVWYAVSGDGALLLGTLTGNDALSSLGIVVGVR